MSTFKSIFKKKLKKEMKERKHQAPFIIKKHKHIHIEDGCAETSTEQLDFKVL